MKAEEILKAAQEGKALQYYNNTLQEWKYVKNSEISLQTLVHPNIVFRIKPETKSKAQEFEDFNIQSEVNDTVYGKVLINLHERLAELEKGGE